MPTMSGGSLGPLRLSAVSLAIFLLITLNLASALTLQRTARVPRSPARSTSNNGVRLNGRAKQHGAGEVCPRLSYCKCRSRGKGLDITCERINSYKLETDCNELKKKEHLVRYFKIRSSDIPKLDDHIFMGIKIEHLYIHDSNLKSVGRHSLSSQGNTLIHLVLSKNLLTEVPSYAVKELHNLEHLNLNENNITVLKKEAFLGLGKVTRLSMYHNQIHRIDPNAFDGLTRDLIRLNLGKNHLTRIPRESLIPLKYLKILDFTENRIAVIENGDFVGMESLDHLTLNDNKLSSLDAGFFEGLDSLTTLYIDSNKIRLINKDAFTGLEAKLSSLTLTGNLIEIFPSLALQRIHQLETLHMDDNKIKILEEDTFQGFGEHIKFLWLQNNIIEDIPAPAFQDLHSLEWVKLFNNMLSTLRYELMEPVLDTLMHIDIHSNPLVCDCDLRWYRQWIDEEWNEIEAAWLKETYCLDPADRKQHNIAEVPLKDMFCSDEVSDKPPKVKDDGGSAAVAQLNVLVATFFLTVHFLK